MCKLKHYLLFFWLALGETFCQGITSLCWVSRQHKILQHRLQQHRFQIKCDLGVKGEKKKQIQLLPLSIVHYEKRGCLLSLVFVIFFPSSKGPDTFPHHRKMQTLLLNRTGLMLLDFLRMAQQLRALIASLTLSH